MPYIKKVHVDGRDGLKEFTIDLKPSTGKPFKHLILIGSSGSGKSITLDGVIDKFYHNKKIAAAIKDSDLIVFSRNEIDPNSYLSRNYGASYSDKELKIGCTSIDAKRISDILDVSLRPFVQFSFRDLKAKFIELMDVAGMESSFGDSFYHPNGYSFFPQSMGSGHLAIIGIFCEILHRVVECRERKNNILFDPEGIVIIDDIENNLRPSVQRKILPLLTKFFPKVQFLVSTHSPLIVSSIPNALVVDLDKRDKDKETSDDIQGIRYGALLTSLFGLSTDYDLDSDKLLERLKSLHAKNDRTTIEDVELGGLASRLSRRSHTMATAVWSELQCKELEALLDKKAAEQTKKEGLV